MEQGKINEDKFRRSAVSVEEAQAKVLAHVRPAESELVPILEAGHRVLASDVQAPHPFPHFRRSGMDGYAIHSLDTKGCHSGQPVQLEVIDEIPCGSLPSASVGWGTASRIMTGAKVPDEADAVIMLEMTEAIEQDGKRYILIKREVEPGKNITPAGFELAEGDLIMEKGRRVGPGEVSVLATFGIHQVPVARKPRVAVFSTGSELLAIDEPLQDGRIRNSNTYMLVHQIREAGGEPYMLEAIEDDLSVARQRVKEAFAEYDIVITTGGVSVGDYDIMAELVREQSLEMLFNKVMMRPGSVTTAAVKEGKLLFALSGNPGACFVGCELFVRPFIGAMLGSREPFLPKFQAVLGRTYAKVNNFTRFVRGSLAFEDGRLVAYPASLDESSVMITIKDSDVLIVIPPTNQGVQAGQLVDVLMLPGGSRG
ncbi:molybdopterin molybdotransferase MoeA [Paenibacillus woosongensis]|uniref:Molybdopterin molybdenumtransferase n=1 Tax=Paenibacillus woosongensis TaxID=307580 RepID=A0ABQ4MU18_9BACL|nr:gephyrin-like molybdotransferase Glp [Paenibacillus woosongensis]GIP59430.1 molybdopterin molybdenumtransferase [Paenibacillus woosongensis]